MRKIEAREQRRIPNHQNLKSNPIYLSFSAIGQNNIKKYYIKVVCIVFGSGDYENLIRLISTIPIVGQTQIALLKIGTFG